jgi:hypothetical protein
MRTAVPGVPLLGALCVAEGLVAQEQLDICLALQRSTYSGTPLGQILRHQGYLSEANLARMVAQQNAFRREFRAALDRQMLVPRTPASDSAPPMGTGLPELAAFVETDIEYNRIFGASPS